MYASGDEKAKRVLSDGALQPSAPATCYLFPATCYLFPATCPSKMIRRTSPKGPSAATIDARATRKAAPTQTQFGGTPMTFTPAPRAMSIA